MLFCKKNQHYSDDFYSPAFKTAFEFLTRDDLHTLPKGRIDLENGVYAGVQLYESKDKNSKLFEAHNRYYDIQFIVSGEEYFYVARREDAEINTPYNETKDCVLFNDPAHETEIYLKAGDMVIVAPDEIHKPGCMVINPGEVKKIVVKVPVNK